MKSKELRRRLRELAQLAYERELSRALELGFNTSKPGSEARRMLSI